MLTFSAGELYKTAASRPRWFAAKANNCWVARASLWITARAHTRR